MNFTVVGAGYVGASSGVFLARKNRVVICDISHAKLEALEQGDARLQVPVVTPVASEVWSAKEATVSEEEFPEWGPAEQRGIQMEIATAMACIASGSHAVILRHPASVETVSHVVRALVVG